MMTENFAHPPLISTGKGSKSAKFDLNVSIEAL